MYKAPFAFVMTLSALCGLPWTTVGAQGLSPPSRVVQMTSLRSADRTQFKKPVRELVRDSATFRRLWREIRGSDTVPSIDFRRSVVILIALGTRSSTGYEVHVRELRMSGNELHVYFDLIEPGEGCVGGAEQQSPATMIQAMLRVPASSPPRVVFHDRKLVIQCSTD